MELFFKKMFRYRTASPAIVRTVAANVVPLQCDKKRKICAAVAEKLLERALTKIPRLRSKIARFRPHTRDNKQFYSHSKLYSIMAIKIKAIEKKMTVGIHKDTYRYQMQPELYSALTQDKVIREAALRSGVSQGVMQACWDAAGEVIKAWATEGHSVALPGLGTMRFGLSAGTVADVNEVKSGLIKTRRIVFTPNTSLKQELKDTAIQITCYDRNGDIVRRVTTSSGDVVTEPETDSNTEGEGSGSSQSGSGSSGSGSGSSTTGGNTSGSVTPSNGDNGGDSGDEPGGDDH